MELVKQRPPIIYCRTFLILYEFVNADEIARGLSPFNFEGVTFQAGKNNDRKIKPISKREEKVLHLKQRCLASILFRFY